MAFMHLLGKLVLPEPDWENQIVDEFTLTDEELRAFDEEVADLFYDEKDKGPWAP